MVADMLDSKPSSPLDYLEGVEEVEEAGEKLGNLTITNETIVHEKTRGFQFLNMFSNAQISKGLRGKYLLRFLDRNLQSFADISKNMSKVVEGVKKFIEDVMDKDEEDHFFAIVAKDSRGVTQAIFVKFNQREDGRYNFKRLLFRGTFELAADLIITRYTNLETGEVEDVVSYLPKKEIQKEDIKDLLDLMVPQLADVMKEFAPKQI